MQLTRKGQIAFPQRTMILASMAAMVIMTNDRIRTDTVAVMEKTVQLAWHSTCITRHRCQGPAHKDKRMESIFGQSDNRNWYVARGCGIQRPTHSERSVITAWDGPGRIRINHCANQKKKDAKTNNPKNMYTCKRSSLVISLHSHKGGALLLEKQQQVA